jgi:alcohol dehydrogenase
MKVLANCFSAVRRGGWVTVVGVYGTKFANFPIGQIFDKGIHLVAGQALVQVYIDELLDLVTRGEIVTDDIITHHMPLSEAPQGYKIFNDKADRCVKVVLRPELERAA